MNELVPKESANVTVAVCGEQGAGKTVFLACIFQSIWTACADDVILDFDRHEIGNADYFRDIEDRLIQSGSPDQGTLPHSVFPARIYVKPYGPRPQSLPPVLSVDIQDFAGRHFRSLANLTGLGAPRDSEPDDVKALRKVNDTLKKADAFIILINAKQIDPLNETPTRNPFSPSVNFLLAHCRAEEKPVALLFTQVDQTPMLTEEVFRSMPRVEAFERQFTADHDEAAAGDRPFGIVRRVSCYETVAGDLAPLRQTLDGNIWKPEPAQVVLELLRAAMPRINARLASAAAAAAAAARRQQEEAELAKERERKRRRMIAAAASAALVLTIGVVALLLRMRHENQKLELLAGVATTMSDGQLSAVAPEAEARLGEILGGYRSDRNGTSPEIRRGIRDVHEAFGKAAQRLADQPSFDSAYADELMRFRRLAMLLDPENTAEWRPTLHPLLDARTRFLSDWFAGAADNQRAAALENAIRNFSAGDAIFARVLASPSSRPRPAKTAA
ncbi:MAG TPA: hypothetical protein VGF48_10720 [Thermoanaerobaculia bacterium]